MRSTLLVAAIAAIATVHATAFLRRRAPLSTNGTSTLQLALYLEHIEFVLYEQACANFTDSDFTAAGFPTGFHENVCIIAEQEAAHISTISSVLQSNGITPISPCNYTFPYTNATSFVSLANAITNVGIGAYLGGSEYLTDNAVLEEASASILAVEARHSTYLRTGLRASPFPASFDTGLTPLWAYNLAQKYILSCSFKQFPGLRVLPTLNVTTVPFINISSPAVLNHTVNAPYANTTVAHLKPRQPVNITEGPLIPVTTLNFSWNPKQVNISALSPLFVAFVNQNVSAPIYRQLQSVSRVKGTGIAALPQNLDGSVFAALTTFGGNLTLDQLSAFGTLAGPIEIVVS